MLLDLIGLGFALWIGQGAPAPLARTTEVAFVPRQRAVSNWRLEGFAHLDARPQARLALLLGRDPAAITRCVRLNNYWCIKRAGWAGEIAADAEGHVAFASAAEGADVAALLLRRYYVDYGRHSALAIVSHWAPAACGLATAVHGATSPRTTRRLATAADHLAVHGIAGTLRARFLAHRGRRVAAGGRQRLRASIVRDRLIGTPPPAATIAVGLGETPIRLPLPPLASLPLNALAPPPEPRRDLACAGDTARIEAYAAHASAGIAAGPDADLKLFDAAGLPTANLAKLMRNMAAVEIGPLGADSGLIADAVARAASLTRGKAAQATR